MFTLFFAVLSEEVREALQGDVIAGEVKCLQKKRIKKIRYNIWDLRYESNNSIELMEEEGREQQKENPIEESMRG